MQLRPRLPSAALLSSLRRAHSTSSSPLLPAFAPTGSTSADTEIPYGDPQLASSAYLPPRTPPSSSTPDRAATESPQFTPRQRQVIESIIRVDQAGELGANYIYSGQHAVLKRRPDKRIADLVQVRLAEGGGGGGRRRGSESGELTIGRAGDVGRGEEAHRRL